MRLYHNDNSIIEQMDQVFLANAEIRRNYLKMEVTNIR